MISKKSKYILMSICLVFLLFGAMSLVSAEDVSDSSSLVDSNENLNSDSDFSISDSTNNDEDTLENVEPQKKNTKIIAKNSKFVPVSGKYFTTTLKDSDGKALVNKTLKITIMV